jgi:hypothetical protein
MSSESVWHVARSWVHVGSFFTRSVVRFMIFAASVWNILDAPSYLLNLKWEILGTKELNSVADLLRGAGRQAGRPYGRYTVTDLGCAQCKEDLRIFCNSVNAAKESRTLCLRAQM